MQEEIIKAIYDWNPWLEGHFPPELRGYTRDYDILQYLKLDEIKILEGARRVGKSTLLYQVIEQVLVEKQRVLYINFDDSELHKYDLKTILKTYLEKTSLTHIDYLFLDEIQHCQDWVHHVRNLYDRKEIKQFWITGSNASLIKEEYKTLLSGRNITLQIHSLSFKEYLRFKQCDISAPSFSSRKESIIKKHFADYLTYGAFPAIALREVYQKELLINYFEDFIFKDIATRYPVNTLKLRDLGIYLATNSTKLLSYRKIAQSLGMHAKTLNDYLSYYQNVFLFSEMYKFDYSLHEQFGSEKKIYCLDVGLAAAVSFLFSEDKGRMLENLVYNQLRRHNYELYFHKVKKECDFIVKEGLDITQLIQVCHNLRDADTRKREIQGLLDAMQVYANAEALILTYDESDEEHVTVQGKERKIGIVPIWQWLLK